MRRVRSARRPEPSEEVIVVPEEVVLTSLPAEVDAIDWLDQRLEAEFDDDAYEHAPAGPPTAVAA